MSSVAADTVPTATHTAPARILVSDPIAADGVARLREAGEVEVATGLTPDELKRRIADADALVVRSETKVTAEVLAAAKRLRVVGRAGVGVDNIDLEAATRHGVLVLNAPTGNTIAAAEHTVALMLCLARNVSRADASVHRGEWDRKAFVGTELREKTLGLLGLGKIGFEVARIASMGLQMRVIATDPLVTRERAEQAGAELVDFEALLFQSDVLSVHVPVNEKTRGIIGAAELARMKKGARVINVARGGIIDEAALAQSLHDGHLAGAAIDVYTKEPPDPANPLLGAPGAVLTPHLGASTTEAQVNVATDVADQIVHFLAGGSPRYAVNLPSLPADEAARLGPWLLLAEKMGSLAAQLGGGKLRRVVCSYAGELSQVDPGFVTAQVLRGLLSPFTDTRVNAVNAKLIAKDHGVAVEERTTTRDFDHTDAMLVEVTGEEKLTLVGTQFEGLPRITRINDFRVDMDPNGLFLVVQHNDRPGVVAKVSGLLARNDINIAGIELGRDKPRGQAVMLIQVDDPVSPELQREMQAEAGLESLRVVTL
ncbi:MAG TPA: phosphoglycerate dehydrogenase [Candidatus Binatia bacterium]|nr:phosphoglycerate dehydrogenase [Candidatus Binatia bacterium]